MYFYVYADNSTHANKVDGSSPGYELQTDIATNSAYGLQPSPVYASSSTSLTAQYEMNINPIYLLLSMSSNMGHPNSNSVRVPECGTPDVKNQTGLPIHSQA